MPQDLKTLQTQFEIAGQLSFRDVGNGFIIIDVNNKLCQASIALQGAQVMTWQPKTQIDPLLWMSPVAKLEHGKSIRGGIPVCWPWFGAHPTESSFAAHGVARTAMWDIITTYINEYKEVVITFRLQARENEQWQHDTAAELTMVVGENLSLTLNTLNLSQKSIEIGQALHTYFHVGDVRMVNVKGLEDCRYVDKLVDSEVYKLQLDSIKIEAEVDRIYLDHGQDILLKDKSLQRTICINKRGSHSTIVWNPWINKTKRLGDMGEDDAYLQMLCIESANADADVVILPAGEKHELFVQYSVV